MAFASLTRRLIPSVLKRRHKALEEDGVTLRSFEYGVQLILSRCFEFFFLLLHSFQIT